jgi:hypothetical protein
MNPTGNSNSNLSLHRHAKALKNIADHDAGVFE